MKSLCVVTNHVEFEPRCMHHIDVEARFMSLHNLHSLLSFNV